MITQDAVMKALSKVNEPELHRDLVALNMVRDLEINGGSVRFTIVLTTPACPLKGVMERDARNAVMAIGGVESVEIKWSSNVPVDNRILGQLQLSVKNVIAIASGKGGVGKSTVAVNVAVALAQMGAAVGLMDADVYGPNANIMLGAMRMPPPIKVDGEPKMVPAQAHGVKLMSMGFLLKPDQPVVWRGPMLHSAVRQFLTDVMWGDLDYMIVDLPPGTGDVQLSLSQSVPLAGGVIVTMPQEVSQADAIRGLKMFEQLQVPVLGVVENMSYLPMPDGTAMDLFGRGGGRKLAEQAGLPFLGEVPIDPKVRVGGDSGVPIVVSDPDSPAAQAFVAIAKDIAAKISLATLSRQQGGLLQVEMVD
ncbi:MAG TPA: Mrp/NBP35 family ATP-binding protein [Anaerolineales bacterium]|nr:Mrp/NBP35 family ATP-binding protein [Anaerolineales bacterium]